MKDKNITKIKINIPTQLFIGNQEILEKETEFFLQQQFCLENKKQPSCYCNECRKIKHRQHESIIFIRPKKNYTLKDVEIIFEKTNLSLDKNQKFFFILENAQNLNTATANKLLKILEEPPIGYNFILQTNNKHSILPTIVSRCYVNIFNQEEEINIKHPIASFFYNQNLSSPLEFDKVLKKEYLNDSQSIKLLHEMIQYYANQIIFYYKKGSIGQDIEHSKNALNFLKQQVNQLPQSGSSKIFWKNLYISFPEKRLFN